MRFRAIRDALVNSWLEANSFDLPTAYQNREPDFEISDQERWARLSVVPSQPGVASLGDTGQDRHDGFLQIDLNYPLDSGDVDAIEMADRIARLYKAGARFEAPPRGPAFSADFENDEYKIWVPLNVLIRSCGRTEPRVFETWSRTTLTIYWSAWVNRGY